MFSRANKTGAATIASETRNGLKTDVPTIISADMKIVGSVESAGDVQMDGRVEGDVTSRTLTVSDSATVHGSITADTVRIAGTVKGGIHAKSVTLIRTAKVDGDIVHEALAIETGASFEGQSRRMGAAGSESHRIVGILDANAEKRVDDGVERSFAD